MIKYNQVVSTSYRSKVTMQIKKKKSESTQRIQVNTDCKLYYSGYKRANLPGMNHKWPRPCVVHQMANFFLFESKTVHQTNKKHFELNYSIFMY